MDKKYEKPSAELFNFDLTAMLMNADTGIGGGLSADSGVVDEDDRPSIIW